MRLTSFVLHAASPDVEKELDNRVRGRKDFVEEHETNNGWLLSVEAKVSIERPVVDEDGE